MPFWERGQTGDHGQSGEPGKTGSIGPRGEKGEKGLDAVAPFVLRHLAILFLLVCVSNVAALYQVYSISAKGDKEAVEALETRRGDLIAGCERKNEIRQAIIDVVNTAYRQRPIPTDITEEEANKLRKANEVREEERQRQLTHKGLWRIDCEAAYPPLMK